MYKIIIGTSVILLTCCSEESSFPQQDKTPDSGLEERVERWYPLQRSIDSYQNLQPNRPILVLFAADWCLSGSVIRKHLENPKILSLCNQYQVLPLIANYTYSESLADKERKKLKLDPSSITSHFFLLRTAEGKDIPFSHVDLNGDSLQRVLRQYLSSNIPVSTSP